MAESNWKDDGYVPSEHGWWRATIDNRGDFGYPVGYYYADTLRAVMIAFANFFNDLYVVRYDEDGFPRKRIQVPIKFGPRAKSHDFRKEQESGETYYIPLPNMYYKITSFQFDAQRASSTRAVRTFYEDYLIKKGVEERYAQLLWSDTQPVPYNIGIELTAKADKTADIFQIVEQLSSRFCPDAFLFIKEFWFMNIRRDIKMKLDQVSIDYQEEEPGEQAKREVEAKFQFTIEAQMYTKITDGAIIDRIITTLNPSIAVFKTHDVVMSFSGSSDPKNPYVYLAKENKNPLVQGGILSPFDMPDIPSDAQAYRWSEDYDSNFAMLAPKEKGIWTFTSAVENEYADRYRTVVDLSGNYAPQPGTYDSASRSWVGSDTERYDFTKLKDSDWTTSGRKDYLNSTSERIDTMWVEKHTAEIAD